MLLRLIKKIHPKKLVKWFRRQNAYYRGYGQHKEFYQALPGDRKIFLVGSPEHDNLGDHSIAYAEKLFLERHFPGEMIIEITLPQFTAHLRCLKKFAGKEDLFALLGGGNMGVEYLYEEELRRETIKNFPHQGIVIFPQTIDFGQTAFGRGELKKTGKIYRSHPRLTIVAREQTSYAAMQAAFPHNHLLLCPDIVLSLDIPPAGQVRHGALLCLRDDRESVLQPAQKKEIAGICRKNYPLVEFTDTCLKHGITIAERERALQQKWSQFSQAELVITDRLHGLIFAAITSTPCIALGNYNHKVKAAYQWLDHLNYLKFADQLSGLPGLIGELKNTDLQHYDNAFALSSLEKIVDSIRENGHNGVRQSSDQ